MEIEYDTLKEEVIRFLNQHKVLFLATCADGRVTARAMSCVHVGLEIYFQTSRDSRKFAQISKNPQVALCAANIAIEGVAMVGEHPLHPASEQFVTLYKEYHPGSFSAPEPQPGGDYLAYMRTIRVDVAALHAYTKAVAEAIQAWLASLAPEDLERELETPIGKLNVGQMLETFVIWHINAHCGEISALKGCQGFKGYPF